MTNDGHRDQWGWRLYYLELSKETEPIGCMNKIDKKRFIISNWLMWFWKQAALRICTVSLWTGDRRAGWANIQFKSKGREKAYIPVLRPLGRTPLPGGWSAFLFNSDFQLTGQGPLTLGVKTTCFTHSTHSTHLDVNFIWKALIETPG